MARKWHLFFLHLQSFLGRRFALWCCGLTMLLLCVTVQPFDSDRGKPTIFTGGVNAASVPIANSTAIASPIDRARQLYEAGNYPQAIELLKQAIETYRGNPLQQAMGWSNLALVYQQSGDWQAANAAISNSLILLENKSLVGRSSILAQTLNIQGQIQFARGQTEAALATWTRTEQLYTQIGDDAGVARSQLARCHALRVLGFYRRAQTVLENLQVSLTGKPDTALKVTTLRSLGSALEQSGDLTRADLILGQSLTIAKKLNLADEIKATQLILGNLARIQQRVPQAIEYYSLAATSSHNLVAIQAKLNLLSLHIEAKQPAQAQQSIEPIQQQLATLPPDRIKFNSQINFAQSLSKIDRQQLAARVLAETIQLSAKLGDRGRTQIGRAHV